MVIVIIFIILKRNKENFYTEEFKKKYGVLIEHMNIIKKEIIYVYPVMLLNRFIFPLIPFVFYNTPAI